ncbi:MAG: ComF family protein [Patescibacteria group bacterium]|jgi:ComF family protein
MLKSFFLNLLFPVRCLNCGNEGSWLCQKCFRRLSFADRKRKNNLIIPNLKKIFIAGDYDDKLLAELIKKFKYNFLPEIGKILGRFLIMSWQSVLADRLIEEKKIILIPIPLSSKRLRWRGFNQAEILAQELADYFSYPISLGLKRTKHHKPQAELAETKRLINVQNAFSWAGDNLEDWNIVLIDDVATTGATLNEAAKTLKISGAKNIYGLVVAKG